MMPGSTTLVAAGIIFFLLEGPGPSPILQARRSLQKQVSDYMGSMGSRAVKKKEHN